MRCQMAGARSRGRALGLGLGKDGFVRQEWAVGREVPGGLSSGGGGQGWSSPGKKNMDVRGQGRRLCASNFSGARVRKGSRRQSPMWAQPCYTA